MKTNTDLNLKEMLLQEQLQQFQEERQDLRMQAKERIQRVQEENQSTFNQHRKAPIKYSVGDRVAIMRTQFGVGLKLSQKFVGPYVVESVNSKDRYSV